MAKAFSVALAAAVVLVSCGSDGASKPATPASSATNAGASVVDKPAEAASPSYGVGLESASFAPSPIFGSAGSADFRWIFDAGGPDEEQLTYERNAEGLDEHRALAHDSLGVIVFAPNGSEDAPRRGRFVSLEDAELLPGEPPDPFLATVEVDGDVIEVPSRQVAFVLASEAGVDFAVLREYAWGEEDYRESGEGSEEWNATYGGPFLDIGAIDHLVFAADIDGELTVSEYCAGDYETSSFVAEWGFIELPGAPRLLAVNLQTSVTWDFHYPTGIESDTIGAYDDADRPGGKVVLADLAKREFPGILPFLQSAPIGKRPILSSRIDGGVPDIVDEVNDFGWTRLVRDLARVVLEVPWTYQTSGEVELRAEPRDGAEVEGRVSSESFLIFSIGFQPDERRFAGGIGWWIEVRCRHEEGGELRGWIPSTELIPSGPFEAPLWYYPES